MLTAREGRIRSIRLKREVACRDATTHLSAFARQAWKIVEPAREYKHNWHIDVICEHLEAVSLREIRNLIINIPPRSMKSLLVSVFWPSWVWNHNPGENWLFGSYSPKLSTRDAVKTRRILESPWYLTNWGHLYVKKGADPPSSIMRPDQNEKMRYENLRAGGRISTSIGGTGTGDGGDIIVVDDPQKVKGVESEVQREGVIDWWDNEMASRGNDPKTVCKLVIMQRVHDNDLTGHLLGKTDQTYEHLCIPFEYEKPKIVDMAPKIEKRFKDPRTKDGELLWKSRYDARAVRDLKASLSIYQRTGQLQQRPTPKEGVTFKRKWFKKRWQTLPETFQHMLTTWDLTFTESETSAYNVGYCLGMKMPNIYVLGEFRRKMGVIGQLKHLPAFRSRFPASGEIIVENAANGQAVVGVLRTKIPGLKLINPVGSKEDRAEAVTWVFEGGNVLFPPDDYGLWVSEAIEEIVGFGPRAKYKDRVDSLVHGVERLSAKMKHLDIEIESHEKLSEWALT